MTMYCILLAWDFLPWHINPLWNIHPFYPPGIHMLNPELFITTLHIVLEGLGDTNIKEIKLTCVPTKYKINFSAAILGSMHWIYPEIVRESTHEKVSGRLVCAVRLPNLFYPLQKNSPKLYPAHHIQNPKEFLLLWIRELFFHPLFPWK